MNQRVGLVCQRNNNVPFVFEVAQEKELEVIAIYDQQEAPPKNMPAIVESIELPVFDNGNKAINILADWANDNQIDAIITQREEAIIWTAQAAKNLGLHGLDVNVARAARDKHLMCQRFKEHGMNVPNFWTANSPEEIPHIDKEYYPLVVKPSSAYGSGGVTRVNSPSELRSAVEQVHRMNEKIYKRFSMHNGECFATVLIEQFIGGPEYLAECFAIEGKTNVFAIGYKGNPQGPYFEEGIYLTPPILDKLTIEKIEQEAIKGMHALGINNGPGHCELRLDELGEPFILEIGARLGGSGTSHAVVYASTGIDYAGLQYDLMLRNQIPEAALQRSKNAAASNYIIPQNGHGIFRALNGLEKLEQHSDFYRLLYFVKPGAYFRPYPYFDGFIGFILGKHENPEAGMAFFKWLYENVKISWEY